MNRLSAVWTILGFSLGIITGVGLTKYSHVEFDPKITLGDAAQAGGTLAAALLAGLIFQKHFSDFRIKKDLLIKAVNAVIDRTGQVESAVATAVQFAELPPEHRQRVSDTLTCLANDLAVLETLLRACDLDLDRLLFNTVNSRRSDLFSLITNDPYPGKLEANLYRATQPHFRDIRAELGRMVLKINDL